MGYIKKHWLNLLVLLGAVSQLISPIFASFSDTSTFNEAEIIPAGYTFAIWGVITSLGFLYGVYQLLPNRKNAGLHYSLGRFILPVYILFSVWLFAADRQWLIATVIIFVAMFLLLSAAFTQIVKQARALTVFERITLDGQIALYTGWSTVAIFANLAACFKHYGFLVSYSDMGILIQCIILTAALVNSIYGIIKFRFNYFYIATILWAFTGVYFGISQKSGGVILLSASIAGIVVIAGMFIFSLLRRQPRPAGQ